MDKLKPCPFCEDSRIHTDEEIKGLHTIECLNPNCAVEITKSTKQEAIEAWNRRTS